jgi:hypothetical protein
MTWTVLKYLFYGFRWVFTGRPEYRTKMRTLRAKLEEV